MTKPDWKDAPEWAQWLAQDADEDWYWYERKPRQSVMVWLPTGERHEMALRTGQSDWDETLEQRPAVQP